MKRTLIALMLTMLLEGCHLGVSEEEAMARVRTPHGQEVTLELETGYVVGELLSINEAELIIEIGSPHHLLRIPLGRIKRIGIDDTNPLDTALQQQGKRPDYAMRKLPEREKKRKALIYSLSIVSRYPQGLSEEFLRRLKEELNVELKTME
jgi:hypothetical protein